MNRPAAEKLREQARGHVLEAQRLVSELLATLATNDYRTEIEYAESSLEDAAAYLEPEQPELRIVAG